MRSKVDKERDPVIEKLLEAIRKTVEHVGQSDPDLAIYLKTQSSEAQRMLQENSL